MTAVSHALNDKGTLSAATREKVRRVADELGYQADPLARGLRNNPLGVVGLMLRPLDSLGTYRPDGVDYFTRLSGAVAVECLDRGMSVMLVRDLTVLPRSPLALSLDGYIIDDPIDNDPVIDLLLGLGVPFVTVGRDVARPHLRNWVGSPLPGDTEAVLERFRESGAVSIALVSGQDRNSWNLESVATYRAWCARHDIPARVSRQPESDGTEGGRAAVHELLGDGHGVPDALYCLTGRHAAGALEELTSRGVRVPHDTQLVAGSDSDQCRGSVPAITAIDLEPELVATAAVELLMAEIGDTSAAPAELRSRLIVRDTTLT